MSQDYRSALQRQPQKQHQPCLQHFQQNKFWAEVFARLKNHFHPVRERRPRRLELLPKNSIYVQLYITSQEKKKNELSEEEEEWIENFMALFYEQGSTDSMLLSHCEEEVCFLPISSLFTTLRIQLPEEGIPSTLEWTVVKGSIRKNDTYFGKSVTY